MGTMTALSSSTISLIGAVGRHSRSRGSAAFCFRRELNILQSTSSRCCSGSVSGVQRSEVRRPFVVSASSSSEGGQMEVLVKASVGEPGKLGDCPFSQRVLLTLEEKNVQYEAKFIDTSNKPDWFLEANPEGKVPVIKHEGKWVADSDVITALLEDLYPEPSLKPPEDKLSIGVNIFGSFVKFLTSKDPSDGTEESLVKELHALDEHLRTSGGPYLNGEKVCSVDLALAPKLYHLKIALGHYKKWTLPEDFQHVKKYVDALCSRESFLKTKPPTEEVVVRGWAAKVNSA